MNILFWNAKGINDFSKQRRIGEFISSERPDWVGLQETTLREVLDPIIGQLVRFHNVGYAFSASVNSAWGLLCYLRMAWNV